MLLNFISWIYITFLSYLYGYNLIAFILKIFKLNLKIRLSPYIILFSGLIVIATIAYYLSFIIPISGQANLIILSLGLILSLANFKGLIENIDTIFVELKKQNIFLIVVATALTLLVLVKSSGGIFHYDTGLYHSQAIQWIEKYPIITGLGNLHFRFAYNSFIFPLFSLFNFSFFYPSSLHSVNGFIVVITLLFSLSGIFSLFKGKVKISDVSRSLIIIALYNDNFFIADVASLSSDLASCVLLLIIPVLMFQYFEYQAELQEEEAQILRVLIVFFCTFAVAVKLSSLPIVLLVVYLVSEQIFKKQYGYLSINCAIIGIIFVPYLIRNIIISGYLIYPFYQIDLFSYDWKIPLDIVIQDSHDIGRWARVGGAEGEAIVRAGFSSWFPIWFNKNIANFSLRFFLFSIFLFLLTLFLTLRSKKLKFFWSKSWILYLTLSLGVYFWFSKAPLLRYGYGFLLSLSCLLITPFCIYILNYFIKNNIYLNRFLAYFILTTVCFIGLMMNKDIDINYVKTYSIKPLDYPTSTVKPVIINGKIFYLTTKSDQCWNSGFPCAPNLDRLEMRGESFQQGFRSK